MHYCPQCDQPVEAGAAYCGNCGYDLGVSVKKSKAALPSYALPNPAEQVRQFRGLVSVLFGAAGIAGGMLIPIIGIACGIAGLVIYSSVFQRKAIHRFGLVLSLLSLLSGLGMWAYNVQHPAKQVAAKPPAGLTVANVLSTPCYKLDFVDRLHIAQHTGSCDISAFNGNSLESSTDAYKIFASQAEVPDVDTFVETAKKAIDKDVQQNLKGFTVNQRNLTYFANSPAYVVNLSDKTMGTAVVEAAILRPTTKGDNIFIVMHATNGSSADLQLLESKWQWQ